MEYIKWPYGFMVNLALNIKVNSSDSYRLVLDGGAGYTQIKLAVLLQAGVNKSLYGSLLLKEQECITLKEGSSRVRHDHQYHLTPFTKQSKISST